MSKTVLYLLGGLLLMSCSGLRVVSNNTSVPLRRLPLLTDSILVVNNFDSVKIDPSAKVLSETIVKAPSLNAAWTYAQMLDVGKQEAQRLHGNVIVAGTFRNAAREVVWSSGLSIKIYNMSPTQVERLVMELNEAQARSESMVVGKCIVHIKSKIFMETSPFTEKRALYFNNKEIAMLTSKRDGFLKNENNFTFSEAGFLSCDNDAFKDDVMHFALEPGHEYFLYVLKLRGYKPLFRPVKKDYFINDL